MAPALAATAQQDLNFADLPLVSSPTLMPNGYGQLNWNNIYYVNPSQWSGAGPSYKDPLRRASHSSRRDLRRRQNLPTAAGSCFGAITSASGPTTFQPVSATVAGGYDPTNVTVPAYNNGNYVGACVPSDHQDADPEFSGYLGQRPATVFQTDAGGDLVFYDLQVYLLGG